MNPLTNRRPLSFHGLRGTGSLAALLVLSACGGGSGSPAPGTTPGGSTPASTVRITGAAVKGPVAGATVCAYPLNGGIKGGVLGACAASASDGSYDFTVPASADILVEAVGGTYLDEATQTQTSLPADRALTSVVAGNAGAVTAYLTPLTTLATNAARASGSLSLAQFQQQSAAVKTRFGLDAALDLSGQAPVVTGAVNDYGRALIAVSRLAAGGLSVSDFLAATDPAALAAAFVQVYTDAGGALPTVPGTPTTPTTPTTPGTPAAAPQASGSLAVVGAVVPSFTPDPAGFSVSIKGTDTTYRFEKQVSYPYGTTGLTATTTAYVFVTRRSQGEGGPLATTIVMANLVAPDGVSTSKTRVCAGTCGITVSSPAGSDQPVTLSFSQFDLSGVTLDGSLTGEAQGAAFAFADLPRTTTGSVSVNGAASLVTTGQIVHGVGPGGTVRTVTLRLQNGGMVNVAELFDPNGVPIGNRTVGYLSPANVNSLCVTACAYTVTESLTSLTVNFSGAVLDAGVVLDGSVTLQKTSGSVSSPTLGGFTPVSDSVESSNDSRTLVYSVLGTPAQGGISLVSVRHRAGVVEQVSVSTGIGIGVYQCFLEAASFIGVPACQGVSVSGDGRSVTFANTAVGGGTGSNRQTATLQGTLTARGF